MSKSTVFCLAIANALGPALIDIILNIERIDIFYSDVNSSLSDHIVQVFGVCCTADTVVNGFGSVAGGDDNWLAEIGSDSLKKVC